MSKKEYQNKCFSPNWLEVDLSELEVSSEYPTVDKEVSLESKRHKDLKTLLKELDEIKENIERAVEKQRRLTNLMGFYTGELAQ